MNIDVTQEVDINESLIVGRNGTFPLKAVRVWYSSNYKKVFIDGIGKSGKTLRAGLVIDAKSFKKLLIEVFDQAGLKVV